MSSKFKFYIESVGNADYSFLLGDGLKGNFSFPFLASSDEEITRMPFFSSSDLMEAQDSVNYLLACLLDRNSQLFPESFFAIPNFEYKSFSDLIILKKRKDPENYNWVGSIFGGKLKRKSKILFDIFREVSIKKQVLIKEFVSEVEGQFNVKVQKMGAFFLPFDAVAETMISIDIARAKRMRVQNRLFDEVIASQDPCSFDSEEMKRYTEAKAAEEKIYNSFSSFINKSFFDWSNLIALRDYLESGRAEKEAERLGSRTVAIRICPELNFVIVLV